MVINESVYGSRENWIAPYEHTEFGERQYAEAYYYNDIASDEKLKLKVANFNTIETPVTTMRSQINGQYTSESYLIRNNWNPIEFTMDNSIVQFGIGPQSGLSKQEWWYVDRVSGGSEPSSTDPPVLKNTDAYDVANICLATTNNYTPFEFYSFGQGSILGGYDNRYMYWQIIRGQTFGTENSFFDKDYDSTFGYGTGYIYSKLVTQIPIKNLKLTPVIYAYNTVLDNYKKFTSIQDYLDEKSTYPNIFCIKAQFRYRNGYTNNVEYNSAFSCYPWFFNPSSFLNGYGYRFNNQDSVYSDNIYYPNRGDKEISEGITVAGRSGYSHGPNGNMFGNEIYWYGHNDSPSSNNFTIGQGGRVLQTPDFKFELGSKNLFYCDVANMSDEDITKGIRKQLASFGLFFVDDTDDLDLALDDEKTFLGILENGVGYGKYSNGSKNREQAQWNWDTMEENDYDPDNPPSPVMPDNWSDTTNPPYSINKTPLPNKWYTCPPAAIPNIMNAVNSIDLENLDKSNTFGLNPIDGIIAIRKMFFNQPIAESFLTGDIVGAITIGVIQVQPEGGVANAIIRHTSNAPYTYIPVTGYPVGEKDELRDFRSYLPYTSCMFYDAFCGSIEIDPAKILNKYITITQTVDFLNGDKITSLYASEIQSNIGERIAMLSGKCCEDVPLNGNRTADYLRNKYILSQEYKQSQWNAISRSAMGAGGASISGISGNVIGATTQAVGTLANTMMAGIASETVETQMTHLVPSVSKINAGTSNVEAGVVSGPTLFLYLPKMNENYDELLYGNLTGFAGYKVVKPKDLNAGTHIFSHPKVSISGTKNEAYMLVDQLQKGIIIK